MIFMMMLWKSMYWNLRDIIMINRIFVTDKTLEA
jgi:hypothetical protein